MIQYMEKASYDWSEDSVRIINTPSANVKMTFFYVQEMGYFKTVPPYFTERAGLSSFLILYTLSGNGVLRYEGEEYVLSKGDCFFIDCMKHHEYFTKDESGWEFLWLHFSGASSAGYYDEFTRNGFRLVNIDETKHFKDDFIKLLDVNKERYAYHEVRSSAGIIALLTTLLTFDPNGQIGDGRIPDYIKNTIQYIDKHFKEEISLSDLSDCQHINKYHLSREFKRYYGITMREYLINSRITYAKELLKYTDLTVNEVAYSCGIDNVSHFINLFKEREEMTPLAYRKNWK